MPDFSVNDNSDVYYGADYWNDLPQVRRHLNELITGDPDRIWMEHVTARVGRVFDRALILNCGNGNVERGLVIHGVVKEAVGIDYSPSLLDEARREADEAGLPLTYHQMDTNTADFPDGPFDVVVNYAAGHHIAKIDKVFRAVCDLLPDDGWFINHDYVGPHRNQYGYGAWDAAWQLNQRSPESFRQHMEYPHLPTMLATDPTEAIHSELIFSTFDRYFTLDEEIPLGGALAYPLLTHNAGIFADTFAAGPWIDMVVDADRAYCATHPDDGLFAFFTGRPNKAALADDLTLADWTADEEAREETAIDGEYYPRSALQDLMIALESERIATLHARTDLADTQQQLDRLCTQFPVPQLRRLAAIPAVEKVRHRLTSG